MTSAADALAIVFAALGPAEQEDAFERLATIRLRRLAGERSETGAMLDALSRVTTLVGHFPTVDEYRDVWHQAGKAEDLPNAHRLIRHFGSWREAREAAGLAEVTTARRIDARFQSRKLHKVWRYTDETLGRTLADVVADLCHVPQVAEFDWWRQRRMELAKASGEDLHLPSPHPYRKRWGSWEGALRHFGYSDDDIAARLQM